MPSHCFVETADFESFARYVCAFREHPMRVYSHYLNKQKVLSSRRVLSNTLLSFYTKSSKTGRYVSYTEKGGKEECAVVNSTTALSNYAPIVQLRFLPSRFNVNPKKIKDKFKPIEVEDLGSLARLTYNPEMPDEPDLTLFSFLHNGKWIIGYITSIDMDYTLYFFNYVKLDKEPSKPFLQYVASDVKEPQFTDRFQHGYTYLPIIKLNENHLIFGLSSTKN
ncbi:MAG: hypothetical protein ACRD91_03805 [Nitrosopumilaceae archaeon]